MDTGSGFVFFPDPDPGDPKRPAPTGSGSATLVLNSSEIYHNSSSAARFREVYLTIRLAS